MKTFSRLAVILIGLAALYGCEFKKNVSRDEIPNIKESIVAFEVGIKAHHVAYIDSLLSSDAADAGTTAQSILDFIYSDSLTTFTGFTDKEIFFRGDAARVDCKIGGPDGPTRPVTITMRKQGDIWFIKKIEPRVEEPVDKSEDESGQ